MSLTNSSALYVASDSFMGCPFVKVGVVGTTIVAKRAYHPQPTTTESAVAVA